jgi:hypothetical protein
MDGNAQQKTLDIYPIGKWKRTTVFLADYFLNFILCIFLYALIVFPSFKASVRYETVKEESLTCQKDELELLYQNKILFYGENQKDDFDKNIVTTNKKFVAYCLGSSSVLEDNIIYNYYCALRKESVSSLAKHYQEADKEESKESIPVYFNYDVLDINGLPSLKDEYKTAFSPLVDEKNSMTSEQQSAYEKFSSAFFLDAYDRIISDILNGSYSSDPLSSYKTLSERIASNTAFLDKIVIIASYVSYVLSIVIYFILVPLFDKRGRTASMMIMKLERVGSDNFKTLSKKEIWLVGIYEMVSCLSFVFFVPLAGGMIFTYLFSLPFLLVTSLISLSYCLVSLIVLLVSKFNMTVRDYLTKSVFITEFDLQAIYASKGYIL